VLSAVDAFISERLSRGGRTIALDTGFRPEPAPGRSLAFIAHVRVAF